MSIDLCQWIDALNGRHHRNGHLLELDGCMWRCLQCGHEFDAAVDAERFWCGDDCTGRHPGDMRVIPPRSLPISADPGASTTTSVTPPTEAAS